ncbi:MAG: hypothetical protein BGO14_00205 [Chlamydiales bacterium 38-26]|nr:MAG: hypothetical protein BGO14_00205 [Chlamydiales bacterium 38-26]
MTFKKAFKVFTNLYEPQPRLYFVLVKLKLACFDFPLIVFFLIISFFFLQNSLQIVEYPLIKKTAHQLINFPFLSLGL